MCQETHSYDRHLRIIHDGIRDGTDFYGGRLGELAGRAIAIFGGRDPRVEPGEIDDVRAALGAGSVHVLADVGHSPHSSARGGEATTAIASAFLDAAVAGSATATGEPGG